MKAIITVIGEDKVGIIAAVSGELAKCGVNILDISQTILQDYFTMIMLVNIGSSNTQFKDLQSNLDKIGEEIGVSIRIQREDIFKSMHKL